MAQRVSSPERWLSPHAVFEQKTTQVLQKATTRILDDAFDLLEESVHMVGSGEPLLATQALMKAKTLAQTLKRIGHYDQNVMDVADDIIDFANNAEATLLVSHHQQALMPWKTPGGGLTARQIFEAGAPKKPFAPRMRSIHWPIRLTFGDKTVVVMATLDTGASMSVMGEDVAKMLGMTPFLIRTRSAFQVRGRLTEFRGYVDQLELVSDNMSKPMCSIGPVVIRVTRFGRPMGMLLGNDIMAFLRMQFSLQPNRFDLTCSTPSPSQLVDEWEG